MVNRDKVETWDSFKLEHDVCDWIGCGFTGILPGADNHPHQDKKGETIEGPEGVTGKEHNY
jgi:hypothetical protein